MVVDLRVVVVNLRVVVVDLRVVVVDLRVVVVDLRVVVVDLRVVVLLGPLRMRTTGRLLLLGSGEETCGLRFMSLVRIILKRFRMLASSFNVAVDFVGEMEAAFSVLMFTTG